MTNTPIVGPITLEDANGVLIATATYTSHYRLRQPELLFQGLMYRQNRQEGTQWVYRQVGSMTANPERMTDPAVIVDVPTTEPTPPLVAPSPPSLLVNEFGQPVQTTDATQTTKGRHG